MDEIFTQDPFIRQDVNRSEIFLNRDLWSKYFSNECTVIPQYIEVAPNIKTLLISSKPYKKSELRPIIIIPGWFSQIPSWQEILEYCSSRTEIYYIETREKTTALHDHNINYDVASMADDFFAVVNKLSVNIEDAVVLASSMGGTLLFNYLSRYDRYPHRTVMLGPNPTIEKPFLLGHFLLGMPQFLFTITLSVLKFYVINFKMNSKNDPQALKYLQVMRMAVPKRMIRSGRAIVGKYKGWEDIAKITEPIILVTAMSDKLHAMERTLKIADTLEKSGLLDFETNIEAHSVKLATHLIELANDDESSIKWNGFSH